MYSRFETQQIPAGIKKINPSELDSIWMKPMDLTSYDNVHIFGDIHGCNTVLQKRLDEIGGIKDDSFYIFLGDYIDRGIENAEVIKFLMSIKDRNNVYMLEGNHERWLWMWGNDLVSRSKEFELVTKPALEAEGISKADARNLYRKLGQCAYFTYGPETYLVTHGGLSTLPENLTLTPTEQMIKGVGSYDDFEKIAETFNNTTPDLCYQIHGHRNTKQVPIVVGERVFNLEGQVEFGGDLRSIHIGRVDEKHFAVRMAYTKNTVFKNQEVRSITKSSLADTIIALRSSKYINETKFGDIPSFNFTKSAFEGNHWNEQTIKARGLYIDTGKGKVVARAYDKFFNINQTEETKLEMLQHKLKFPVTAYVKENGFLGIVSYVEGKADLFITTKSNPEGDWAKYLKNMIYRKMTDTNYKKMKDYIKKNDVSFVFECVDMTNDPHIIDYPESKLVLLDIVYNDINFKKYSYEEMCYVANQFGLQHKERACEISNWQEFYDWYHEILEESYEYNSKKIEGFVIEDSNGYMVKVKLTYYNFWKFM